MNEQDEREAYNEYHRQEADFYAEREYEPGWCPYCGEPEELCRASHPNGTCQPGAAGQE